MAIGWYVLLKTVPWADVIASAPAIADGAKKLWKTVAKKSEPAPVAAQAASVATLTPANEPLALVEAQLAALETTVSELQQQMLASSELIKALADQNTELVKRVEASRVRLLWLSGTFVVAVVLVAMRLVA